LGHESIVAAIIGSATALILAALGSAFALDRRLGKIEERLTLLERNGRGGYRRVTPFQPETPQEG